MTFYLSPEIANRRQQFFAATRSITDKLFNSDGSGKIQQFNPPYREPVWILPAYYNGDSNDIALANRILARYNSADNSVGNCFNIFQSTILSGYFVEYKDKLTPAAETVIRQHIGYAFDQKYGAARADFKFHGCNDNMPMMATKALILAGDAVGDKQAYKHGVWRLYEFARLLQRAGWASEFNSSTYSPVTLANVALIAEKAADPEIRQLALQIEERLWAEVIMHYHPATLHSAGPSCRAYMVDSAGHNHSLQLLFWLIFGADTTGRDLIKSYFTPDGKEVIHFSGNYYQSIAEYCDMISPDFHCPDYLAVLFNQRSYPAYVNGHGECLSQYNGMAGQYQTNCYMTDKYSLGTVDTPLVGGEQTMQLYATYARENLVTNFRQAATIFYRYQADKSPAFGDTEVSDSNNFASEKFLPSQAWCYAMQKNNTAMITSIPNLRSLCQAPDCGSAKLYKTSQLKMAVVFPAHFGKISRSVIGNESVREGAVGESERVCPVSVETGLVYVHIYPLLSSPFPRRHALRFANYPGYENLELINFEGDPYEFGWDELIYAQNGFVLTIDDKSKYNSLLDFHKKYSQAKVLDYYVVSNRFVRFERSDVCFDLVYTPQLFGVQTSAIDNHLPEHKIIDTNMLDINQLPFIGTAPIRNPYPLPWQNSLATAYNFNALWQIGARFDSNEVPYQEIHSQWKPTTE